MVAVILNKFNDFNRENVTEFEKAVTDICKKTENKTKNQQ
jgi:hypothetical protein